MKKILALLLAALMLLPMLASCRENNSTENTEESANSSETQGNGVNQDEPIVSVLTESSIDVNMSAFGEDYRFYVATDLGKVGKGSLNAQEGIWDIIANTNGTKSLKASRTTEGSQYQSAKWTFDTPYSYEDCQGILFHADFSAANTSNFHGAVIRLYTKLDGMDLIVQPSAEMTAYSSVDGQSWVERTVHEQDTAEMHVALDKNFVGYIYIPFSQYEGIENFDLITALDFGVCRITSGEVMLKDFTVVSFATPYSTPDLSAPQPPIESVDPVEPAETPDMSDYVENAQVVQITDFNGIGAGKTQNATANAVLGVTEEKFLSVGRDGGDWMPSFDWVFDTPINFTGMAGILVKVDFTGANTNSTQGGHGISVGIHTYTLGNTAEFNAPSLGGYAFNTEKDAWQKMGACQKHSDLLVVDPAKYSRYDGYVFIPLSAFGETEIRGINCVTSLTLKVGAVTSGTVVVKEIILVKGTELVSEDTTPVVNRDNVGPAIAPSQITSPVDLSGLVSDGSVYHVTDFGSVGAGKINNAVGKITAVESGLSIERDGDWYDGFEWIFDKAQDFTGASGILIRVDFTSANTDSTKGFHGIALALYTKALGDNGAAKIEPAKGGYLYTDITELWIPMDVSTQKSNFLDGGKRYSGYIFIPVSSLEGLSGLEHVTGFKLNVGAITSGIAYVEDVYMVKGTVEVEDPFEKWFEDSKKEQYYSALENVTVNALGDSYFAGNGLNPSYVWPQLLATKYGYTLNNYGRNGSTVSNFITTKNPMCERYVQMVSGADIILVEGGRNDYNNAVPIGTVDSYDTTTFMGALNTIVRGLKQSNPNAMIVMVTNWKFNGTNSAGLTYADYANAMVAVAEAQGVYCINASDPTVIGVDMSNADFRANYSMSATDVSHLNLAGMMYVMPKFENIIGEYYTEFLADKGIVKPTTRTETVETQWHQGYVGSSTNTNWAGKINTTANNYSYSDVIVIEKAGTVLKFTDTDSNNASASAYVISFWKQVDGEWVIDETRTHFAGGSAVQATVGTSTVYSYTTQSDHEAVRLCYNSGHTATNIPENFAEVTVTVTVTSAEE